MRTETSWPLASTSTTSTSRMEHATCSTSHNHDFLHLPSLMVHHLHSQSVHVNSGPTSTSASSSTSISLTSPTMRRNLLRQTSWFYRQQQEHVRVLTSYVIELASKHFKPNVSYLKTTVGNVQSSTERHNKLPTTAMHNNYFRMQQLQQYIEQANSSATSLCILPSRVASRTTYLDDFKRTNIGWEMFRQLRHQYAAGVRVQQYTLLQGIVHPQPRWTETSQQQQFQKWIQDTSAYKMIHPVIDDALKVSTAIKTYVDRYNSICYFRFVHIIHGKKHFK